MDMVFLLDEETRSAFIRSVVRMLRWRYICLWSHRPSLPGCLLFVDGHYEDEDAEEASPSAGSFGRRLFDAYSGTAGIISSGVPGLAFKEGTPCLMLAEASLQFMATTEAQRQFYQGARIKYAVFLACRSGEIEMGTSSDKVSLEMEDIRDLFAEDVIKQFGAASLQQIQERSGSSSSSTLRSVSLGSPEYSSGGLLPMISSPVVFHAPVLRNPTAIQPRPSAHMVDAAMTKAMLAVLSSSAPTSSSSPSSILPQSSAQGRAFQRYSSASSRSTIFLRTSLENQHLLKLSVAILRGINIRRRIQSEMVEDQPSASQLSHVISERKRREKLNESFQALRALLPPGSKKDKVSILAGARETLAALRAEVAELERRNQVLRSQSTSPSTTDHEAAGVKQASSSGDHGTDVTVTELWAGPEEREVELRIRKGRQFQLMDLMLRLLGSIRYMENVELEAVSADFQQEQHQRIVVLRLKIKGGEWSRSMLEEAVAREFGD
ncbi:unnamed protein product [Victoria cruziana]